MRFVVALRISRGEEKMGEHGSDVFVEVREFDVIGGCCDGAFCLRTVMM